MSVESARPKQQALRDSGVNQDRQLSGRKGGGTVTSSQPQNPRLIQAMELPKGRTVKRGWTNPADSAMDGKLKNTKASQKKSKTNAKSPSDKSECLFKTNLPPNKSDLPEAGSSTSKKRKRSGLEQEVVIREFQKTTQCADDGIEESRSAGTHVERAPNADRDQSSKQKDVAEKGSKRKQRRGSGVGSSGPDVTSAEVVSPRKAEKASRRGEARISSASARDADEVQGSLRARGSRHQRHAGKDRPRDDDSDATSLEDREIEPSQVERLSISRSSSSPQPHVSTQPTSEPSTTVHPLEALFKRPHAAASQSQTPRKPHLEVSTAFSFFDAEATGPASEDTTLLMPQTPFTQQDFRNRRQRSAAPTPDTALPGKTFDDILGEVVSAESQSEGGEEGQVTSGATGGDAEDNTNPSQGADSQESENVKWFYEQRGANRRSWQRERREATKSRKFRDRKEKR